jgi:hypothetical protein
VASSQGNATLHALQKVCAFSENALVETMREAAEMTQGTVQLASVLCFLRRQSETRATVSRNYTFQVDATPRSGDPARNPPGHTDSGFALEVEVRAVCAHFPAIAHRPEAVVQALASRPHPL